MRIVLVHADTDSEWNCSQWRIVNPAYGLRRIGVDVEVLDLLGWQSANLQGADAVVLQRNVFGDNLKTLEKWRGLGVPVYIDLDDAYQMLPETNVARRFWIENVNGFNPSPIEQLRYGLSISSGLTSPSKLLLDDWAAPEKVWLPNYVRAEWYRNVARRPHEGVVIGWGGSMSHADSWRYSGAVAALVEACRCYSFVRVAVCGNDRANFDMLHEIPPRQKFWVPGVPQDEWPRLLAQFDIGLAPLWSEYDRRRSWLKVVEYACAGVPCIVSKSDPYADLTDWSLQVTDDWLPALCEMIDNIDTYRTVATGRRVDAVLQFSIEANAGKWIEGLT